MTVRALVQNIIPVNFTMKGGASHMSRYSLSLTVILFSHLLLATYISADTEEIDWKPYYADEFAAHYYEFKEIRKLSDSVVSVLLRIVPKGTDKAFLKELYWKRICLGTDFSGVQKIKCGIELECSNNKYRVVGGVLEEELDWLICEPRREWVQWDDIPSGSAVEKLSNIICPK